MVLVKVCGITNFADARAAIEAGADALGFNFFPRSPRYVQPEAARVIIDRLASEVPAGCLIVGVFVNETIADIQRTAATAGVNALQLHGTESPEYCRALKGHDLIKVFSADAGFAPESVLDYDVDAIMIDAADKQRFGGTGKRGDWNMARRTRDVFPRMFLAGGLSAENVAEAIEQVRPYAVDACSLLESAPGMKDHEKVQAFVAAVRGAGF